MRKGMSGAGFALFLFAGFWSYEFYVLYQDMTTLSGSFGLAFGSSKPFSYYIMNAIGFQNAPYQKAVTSVEIFTLLCVVLTLVGLVAFVLGASAEPVKKKD